MSKANLFYARPDETSELKSVETTHWVNIHVIVFNQNEMCMEEAINKYKREHPVHDNDQIYAYAMQPGL